MEVTVDGARDAVANGRPYLDWNLDFIQTPNTLARDYWFAQRRDNAIPTRAGMRPGEMRKFIAHAGLVEIRPATRQVDYFVRLAGTRWEDVFGPMTGRFLEDFLPPEIELRWRTVFDAVRKAAKPVCVNSAIEFQRKSWLTCELLVAPLGEAPGAVSMLFISFVAWSALQH